MSQKPRYFVIDLLRTLAILGMVIYHFFFILDFYAIKDFPIPEALSWTIFRRSIQFTFLGLVGVSLAISKHLSPQNFYKKQLRRALKIAFMAIIVTITTFFTVPDFFVRFGILHLIAAGIFIASPLAHKKYLPLLIAILLIAINFIFFINISTESTFLAVLGLHWITPRPIDHFTLVPWLALILIGISIGNFLLPHLKNSQPTPLKSAITFISKNSLRIYLIHVPIIIAILLITRNLRLYQFL